MELSLRWTSKQDRLTRTTKIIIGVVPSIKEIPMCYLVAALIAAKDTEQAVCLLTALELPIYWRILRGMRSNLCAAERQACLLPQRERIDRV
jgi:predicted acyltransferase